MPLQSEFRLFISGTFLDMVPEREHLAGKVFPEIRQLFRERGIVFTDVDLRWGITERQARRGRIISTCLDEVCRRKPFVIALVGDRYGWQPSIEDIANSASIDTRYPWVRKGIEEGRSLVELETLEAQRHNPAMQENVRFYFKRKRGKGQRGNPDNPLVTAFHNRVKEAGIPCRDGYGNPTQLGKWIREDLIAELNRVAPMDTQVSWLERERRDHEAFALSRRSAYVETDRTLRKLDQHVVHSASNAPLVVTGESGSGKSALLSWWSSRFRERNPDAFLITHYVGSTPLSGDHIGLMRRVAWEIRERYGMQEEPPADPDTLVREFPSWIARTQNETLILVIDALNQMSGAEDDSALTRWLPEHFPSAARVILSTTDGPTADLLHKRKWPVLRVKPLSKTQRQKVVHTFLDLYGKEIEARQVQRIVNNNQTANPFYLRTSLEELRRLGDHEMLNEQISHYLEASDNDELLGLVLEGLENDFGKGFTPSVMKALWASRNGLSENELTDLLGCTPVKLHALLGALEYHLMRRGGLLTFYHDHLRQAVENRYLNSVRGRRAAHRRLGRWFTTQPISQRRAEEEPWAWTQAAKIPELESYLKLPLLLTEIVDNEGFEAFFRYRNALSQRTWPELMQRITGAGLRYGDRKKPLLSDQIRVLQQIGLLMREAASLKEAGKLISKGYQLALSVQENTDHSEMAVRQTATLQSQLGTVLQAQGDYMGAEVVLRGAIETLESIGSNNRREYADAVDNLAMLLYVHREYGQAEPLFRKALTIRRKRLGDNHPDTILSLGNMGANQFGKGQYLKARTYFLQALNHCEKALGAFHPRTAEALNNLATSYRGEEKYEEAIPLLERALKINEAIFGQHHPEIASNLNNLGFFELSAGIVDKSYNHYRRALSISTKVFGEEHPSTALCWNNLAGSLRAQQDWKEAGNAYTKAFEIRLHALGPDHIGTHLARINIAGILIDQERYQEALDLYAISLPHQENHFGPMHPEVLRSKERSAQAIRGTKC